MVVGGDVTTSAGAFVAGARLVVVVVVVVVIAGVGVVVAGVEVHCQGRGKHFLSMAQALWSAFHFNPLAQGWQTTAPAVHTRNLREEDCRFSRHGCVRRSLGFYWVFSPL